MVNHQWGQCGSRDLQKATKEGCKRRAASVLLNCQWHCESATHHRRGVPGAGPRCPSVWEPPECQRPTETPAPGHKWGKETMMIARRRFLCAQMSLYMNSTLHDDSPLHTSVLFMCNDTCSRPQSGQQNNNPSHVEIVGSAWERASCIEGSKRSSPSPPGTPSNSRP